MLRFMKNESHSELLLADQTLEKRLLSFQFKKLANENSLALR